MSTAIAFRFLAGRYHSTPWGAHVNEAALEWPPSPWRVLRGLIAVWHRKVDPEEISEERLEQLIEELAQGPIHYAVPAATHAHTRHYMPIRDGRGEKPTLVFDAFASVSPTDDLVMLWPQLALDDDARARLALLLRRLGYLGRAESWVEASLLDGWDGMADCRPASDLGDETGIEVELDTVVLPTPVPPSEYRSWRDREVAKLGLDRARLNKSEARLLATLPERLLDALRLDSSAVRAQGWNRYPGLAFTRYLRPADAIGVRPARHARSTEGADPTTVRLILTGKPLPQIEDAIRIGEVLRAAAMYRADRITEKDGDVPPVLSGHDMGPTNRHAHAFYLAEDTDDDGRIDHILLHADLGFDDVSLRALGALRRIWLDGGQEWGVVFENHGSRSTFTDHPYLRASATWTSVSPYLHPWHRKTHFNVEDQIRKECRARGLPQPELTRLDAVKIHGRERRPVHFHRFRTRNRRRLPQPDTRGSFWTLTFPERVTGPIALGFGCHFGLGIFRAARSDS